MGLAAPKNKIKLSHDPNNTKWTNDTQSFGHKMMTLQGWQPGEHLGVKNSAYAELHTEANFSPIRVLIKDDNLGLGAKNGSGVGPGECTGLDAFQNLLGRLNGRDEDEMEKEIKSREELKRAIYAEQRWGTIRFVKGGLLVGDKIQPLIDAEKERVRKLEKGSSSDSSSEEESDVPTMEEKAKKAKKRKLEEVEETALDMATLRAEKSKKRKLKREDRMMAEVVAVKAKKSKESGASQEEVPIAMQEIKLSKKKSKKERESKVDSEDTPDSEDLNKQRKKERVDRKREKKEKKEAKFLEDSKLKSKRDKKKVKDGRKGDSSESSRSTTKESTPLGVDSSGRSTPIIQGMHAVRARNIAQKRLASMDVAALNQIFMIKSQT